MYITSLTHTSAPDAGSHHTTPPPKNKTVLAQCFLTARKGGGERKNKIKNKDSDQAKTVEARKSLIELGIKKE